MLQGRLVGLRARDEADVAVLHRDLYNDVATRANADTRPWRPLPATASPYATTAPSEDTDFFSVVELSTNELAGEALLWGVDAHNRNSHLGLSLRPDFRGRGLGEDTLRTLCEYGFTLRGLHRMQLETLSGNEPMIRAATRVGFRREGHLRGSQWLCGEFCDTLIYGLLAGEWLVARTGASSSAPEREKP